MNSLEKQVTEQGKRLIELKADLEVVKESLPDMKEIKELLLEIKKHKTPSEDGASSVNKEDKGEKTVSNADENSSDDSDEEPRTSWLKKVVLPTFEGDDPLGWIARAEKFFEVQGVKPTERLRLAFISMEGNVVHWFQFWHQHSKNASWEEFTAALLRRFGSEGRGTVYERLAAVRQKGGVEDFIQEFELLVAQASQTPEDQLMGYFLAGLRPNIRNQVRPHDPKSLIRTMEIARDVEEAMKDNRFGGAPTNHNSNSGFRFQGGGGVVSRFSPVGGNTNSQPTNGSGRSGQNFGRTNSMTTTARTGKNSSAASRNRGTRTLPYAEFVKRRDEGKCYQCGLPFGTGHRCPEKNLRVIILAEDETVTDAGDIIRMETEEFPGDESGEAASDVEPELKGMELSMCSAGGLTQPQTMKLRGKVLQQAVMILIDSGASHNFISSKLVKSLGLQVESTKPYKVKLGDGNRKQTQGRCKDIEVQLGNYAFTGEFFLFELGEVDLILGVAWLATLGEVKVNWRNLTMKFVDRGRSIEIKGDHSLTKALVSPQALLKVTDVEAVSVLWEIQMSDDSLIQELGNKLPEAKRGNCRK